MNDVEYRLLENEVFQLRDENERLKAAIFAANEVQVYGARMDVTPTRMGVVPEAMEEMGWWQNWLLRFDENWRKYLREALDKAEGPAVPEVLRRSRVSEILNNATMDDWISHQDSLVNEILNAFTVNNFDKRS